MNDLNKVKDFFFSTKDNFIDRWIKEKLLFGNDTIPEMIINNAKEEIQKEISSFSGVLVISLTTIIDIAAVGALGYMLYRIIRFMFLQSSEDSQKALFTYFCLMLLRILSTVLRVQLGVWLYGSYHD